MKDIQLALRRLRKSPGFSGVAVLTLSLAIGAATAVFSIFNAVLLRSLPVPDPQQLRVLSWSGIEPRVPSLSGDFTREGDRHSSTAISPALFERLRLQAAEVAEIFAFALVRDFTVQVRGETRVADAMVVSDNFFTGLKIQPLLGHLFRAGDAQSVAEQAQTVVISWDWWQRAFAGSPEVIGQTITLRRQNFTVIGVLPPTFKGIRPGVATEFYALLAPGSPLLERPLSVTGHWWVHLMARIRTDVSESRVAGLLTGIFAAEVSEIMRQPEIVLEPGRAGFTEDRALYEKPLGAMLGIVGIVVLVACVNLAGMMLARNAARQHELAVRAALGARRWQRLRESLLESLLLSLAGGALGVLVAMQARTVITDLLVGSASGLHYQASVDWTVLAFSLGAVIVTALLSGIIPALCASRMEPAAALKERQSHGTGGLWSGKALVIGQIALSLLLLCGAGLYIRTVVQLNRVDPGFDTDRLLLFQLRPADAGYEGERLARFYQRVEETLSTLPGVSSCALIHYPLLGNQSSQGGIVALGQAGDGRTEVEAHRLLVSENFFNTLGIPLLQGEGWRPGDSNAIVINEAFAKRLSPNGGSPIGTRLNGWGRTWEVRGICKNIKHRSIKEPAPLTAYFSFLGRVPPATHFAVRTKLPPMSLVPTIRSAVARLDTEVPMTGVTTQELVRNGVIGQERLFAILGGALGGLVLLLSCLGLYGLMAFSVGRRSSEFAVRMALGARPGEVAGSILREALVLLGIGFAAGAPLVFAMTGILRSHLFGVGPNDPFTLCVAVLVLTAVTILAAWLPARRAAQTDPNVLLRAG